MAHADSLSGNSLGPKKSATPDYGNCPGASPLPMTGSFGGYRGTITLPQFETPLKGQPQLGNSPWDQG